MSTKSTSNFSIKTTLPKSPIQSDDDIKMDNGCVHDLKDARKTIGKLKKSAHEVITNLQLGAIIIRAKSLGHNKLSISYPCNKARINSKMFSRCLPISDQLKDIIYGLTIRDESLDLHKYYALNVDEKRILRNMLKHARLSHLLSGTPSTDEEEEQLLNRYELLKGTILAGNSSKPLLAELNELMEKMLSFDLITPYLYRKILTSIYQTLAESNTK